MMPRRQPNHPVARANRCRAPVSNLLGTTHTPRRVAAQWALLWSIGVLLMTLYAPSADAASAIARIADSWTALPAGELEAWISQLTPAQSAPCPACSSPEYRWVAER